MNIFRGLLGTTLAILLSAPTAWAQQTHVVSEADLEKAVHQRVAQDDADRVAIRSLLHRSEVREIAGKAGLSVETAEAAVSLLQGDDLRELAGQARAADEQLAGGASTIVISTTTIIIILLIVILIVVIAK
ncbi:MAG TPA: hypothetical protein VH458_11010 [Vicinamibacterales bacterium]|jgi:hypothetical protein